MLAARIHAKEDLRLDAFDTPSPGAGEVLLKLGAGGICGSDLHYYFEGRNGSFVVREPLIPGHEASGVVVSVGAGVTRVKPGDKDNPQSFKVRKAKVGGFRDYFTEEQCAQLEQMVARLDPMFGYGEQRA